MDKFVSEITGYGYEGEGVCRIDGKVCFLPLSLKGEEVEFKINKETSSFCKGRLEKVLKASPNRTFPPCPYFGKCGGCAYQHTDYQNELDIKKNLLKSHLSKVNFDGEIQVVASDNEYGYRNKIKLFVGDKEIGLKQRESDKICDIERCLICDQKINETIASVKAFVHNQNLYQHFSEIVIRTQGQQVLVNLRRKTGVKINYQGLFLILGKNSGIFENYKGKQIKICGLDGLLANEEGINCEFGVNSFHQVNNFVMPRLYSQVEKMVQGKTVINGYSGAGVLSAILAKKCKKVIGIELGLSEHEDAEKVKQLNNLTNLINIHGDCGRVLKEIDEKVDMVVIDPPRAGIDQSVVEAIDNFACQKLIYISCNPATLVRDVERLKNFSIDQVWLYDMFARTSQYEVLCTLKRTKCQ